MKKSQQFFRSWKRTMSVCKRKKKSYVYFLCGLNTILEGLAPLLIVFIPRLVIDYLSNEQVDQQQLLKLIIVLISSVLVLNVATSILRAFAEEVFIHVRMSEWVDVGFNYKKIDYVHLEDVEFQDRFEINMEALNADSTGFQGLLKDTFDILPLCFSAILYGIVLCTFQPLIFLACLLGTAVSLCINHIISKYELSKKKERANKVHRKNYFYQTCSDFTFGKEIRLYGMKEKLEKDYDKASNNYLNVIKNIARHKYHWSLFELIFLFLQDALAYYFIISRYFQNELTLGEVSLYVGLIIALSSTTRIILDKVKNMITNAGYCTTYYEFIDNKEYYGKEGTQLAIPSSEAIEIEFRNVSFKYPKTDRYIIKDFSFKIHKGEKLAIVGVNGAGKSTLIKLITGLFEVTSGEIRINDIPINDFKRSELQKMFSVVFQDIHIYAGSVIENVIGNETSEEAITLGKECLKQVGLQAKIESLPNQYETSLLKIIDENGVELSGGENQKIAIARALYKNGNVIILDEPTSALDALAEAEIYQSFDKLVGKKTSIYISHRLSSTKFCDMIALFGPEGLLEYGTHDELLQLKGKYFEMFKIQGKYYQEEGDCNEKACTQ